MTTATATSTPQTNDLIGWMRKNNRAVRAARSLAQFFDVVCQTTMRNFDIWGSDDNVSSQQSIFHSLPLHGNHSCQASESTLRLFRTTWPTWNHRKTLNLTQSSIWMWRFRCSSCRSFLRTVPTIVIAHTFCASRDTRVSYRWCLLIQGYFCAV